MFIRQSMKDTSGATVMDPATQVTSLHGVAMLDAALQPFESNLCLAVLREPNGPNDNKLANVAIAAHVNLHGDPILAAAEAAREAGNAPNSVLAAAASILGPRRVAGVRQAATEILLDLFLRRVAGRADESSTSPASRPTPSLARRRARPAGRMPCSRRWTRVVPNRCSCATCAALGDT